MEMSFQCHLAISPSPFKMKYTESIQHSTQITQAENSPFSNGLEVPNVALQAYCTETFAVTNHSMNLCGSTSIPYAEDNTCIIDPPLTPLFVTFQ